MHTRRATATAACRCRPLRSHVHHRHSRRRSISSNTTRSQARTRQRIISNFTHRTTLAFSMIAPRARACQAGRYRPPIIHSMIVHRIYCDKTSGFRCKCNCNYSGINNSNICCDSISEDMGSSRTRSRARTGPFVAGARSITTAISSSRSSNGNDCAAYIFGQ